MPNNKAYFLSPDAYVCQTDDGLIVLDLKSNSYLGIGTEDAASVIAALNGNYLPHSDSRINTTINDLHALGILTTRVNFGKPYAPCAITMLRSPRHHSSTIPIPAISFRDVFHFAEAYATVMILLRLAKLRYLINKLQSAQNSCRTTPDMAEFRHAMNRVAVFQRIRPWIYTARNECLFDSLVLSFFLRRSGCPSTLVIGVSTNPFAAHAWVQFGSYVIDSNIEDILHFKPIVSA